MEYPIIRRIMKMTAGSIFFPVEVKKIFADQEDHATAEIWFKLLENEFLCQYILCPEMIPKALSSSIDALTKHEEIKEQIDNTAYAYLIYGLKKYAHVSALRKFFQLELEKRTNKNFNKTQSQKIHDHVVQWLERTLEKEFMIEHQDEISDLFKIIIFTRSDIMQDPDFYNMFFEKRADIVAFL